MTAKAMTTLRCRLKNITRTSILTSVVVGSTLLLFGAVDGAWLSRVPQRDHERVNPYHEQPEAIAAGRRIFEENCAPCHGQNAEGKKKRPTLRSERVQQQATEGDLHWLLVNGYMSKGMPSWSKLPDQQLWQVISFVKSLQVEPASLR
jgi:mono/diheme cytochrome c family protein